MTEVSFSVAAETERASAGMKPVVNPFIVEKARPHTHRDGNGRCDASGYCVYESQYDRRKRHRDSGSGQDAFRISGSPVMDEVESVNESVQSPK